MILPYFVKFPAFLYGLGIAGLGTLGIGGWQLVEEIYPVGDKRLSQLGFHSNIPKPALDVDVDTGSHSLGESPFKFQSNGCFQNFFLGATVNHSVSNNTIDKDNFVTPSEKDIKSDTNPIGCVLMNFSYETDKSKNSKIKYIFKAEVTSKNDRFGWALWAGAKRLALKDSKADNQQDSRYYLTFLKRDSDGWKVLGGYSWKDYALSQEILAADTKIISPKKGGR